ncbi:hypothetical protein BCR44DRAFT_1252745 [Catenaria anguillulae PL171]|uniref:Uncharacterized protein n=1 Tax=Catenaria anguillulae PL171 TaxID=765915 RepID=A0A1Y2HC42_9FUNG|nr:hypothetical protein BCR44DRAFT_1252745 [Catenaria anguillulae PL171]
MSPYSHHSQNACPTRPWALKHCIPPFRFHCHLEHHICCQLYSVTAAHQRHRQKPNRLAIIDSFLHPTAAEWLRNNKVDAPIVNNHTCSNVRKQECSGRIARLRHPGCGADGTSATVASSLQLDNQPPTSLDSTAV